MALVQVTLCFLDTSAGAAMLDAAHSGKGAHA